MKHVFIVIVNYFSRNVIAETIKRLDGEKVTSFSYTILVVDNSGEILSDKEINTFSNVKLLGTGTNLGYCGGNNVAYEYIIKNKLTGDIVICNPDTFFSLNQINEIVQKVKEWGVYTLPAVTPEGNIMYTRIRLKGLTQKIYKETQSEDFCNSDYCPGSFLYLKLDEYNPLETLFDERFFMYWEEVDLCINIRKLGGKCCFINDVGNIIRTPNEREWIYNASYYYFRNSFLIRQKHESMFSKIDIILFFMKSLPVFAIKALYLKKNRLLKNIICGIVDGYKRRYGIRLR
ncbi:glycosyltransferase family 2 protein [Citrobacter portucalensis]|uniref:glycosyltransferase family 2 protein n=1 Tax=Citrobacter portucalensis TaxID=1639133 RepID=UPI001A294326|nr:glycosyltransferase family 2 protein [Citrobacter portucalensis]